MQVYLSAADDLVGLSVLLRYPPAPVLTRLTPQILRDNANFVFALSETATDAHRLLALIS